MALQLTGAAKTDSLANMQLRLPVVVVGGGLTAIDTATESLAYYPVQVEKFLARYETLVERARRSGDRGGVDDRRARDRRTNFSRTRARSAPSAPPPRARGARRASSSCCRAGAASTIAYRRRLIDSPSYTLNHEEVEKALEEGIRFAEGLTPLAVDVDADGRACATRAVRAAQRRRRRVARARSRDAARAHDPDRRRHAAQHRARARGRARTFISTASIFRLLDEDGQPVTPGQGSGQARGAGGAHRYPRRRPRDELLRRPASRRSPATSSRRWRARSRALRSCRGCSRTGRTGFDRQRCGVFRARSTTSCARRSSASSG